MSTDLPGKQKAQHYQHVVTHLRRVLPTLDRRRRFS